MNSHNEVFRLLRRAGHKVHAVADGGNALNFLARDGSNVNWCS